MPRLSCRDCARKHLAQACVLACEVLKGYAEHTWLVVGHMAEAEDELVLRYPELANEIRKERLRYLDWVNQPDKDMEAYQPDFLKLIARIGLEDPDPNQQTITLEVT